MNDRKNLLSPWTLTKVGFNDVVRLKIGRNIVGRAAASDITLNSNFISRRHCSLEVSKNRVLLRDFSSNGVFVNTTAYLNSEKELKNGDRIGFGCDGSDIICHIENYPVYYLKYKSIRNPSHNKNNDEETNSNSLENEPEILVDDDNKEEKIDVELNESAKAIIPANSGSSSLQKVALKTLLSSKDNHEQKVEQKNDENSNIVKRKSLTYSSEPKVQLKEFFDVIVISDDDDDDKVETNKKEAEDGLLKIEICDSNDEMNTDADVDRKQKTENDIQCSKLKEELSTNLTSKQEALNANLKSKTINESLKNENFKSTSEPVNFNKNPEPIAGPSGYREKQDISKVEAQINELNEIILNITNEPIDIEGDKLNDDDETQNKIKMKIKDEPIDVQDENEENIDIKLSQSFNRCFKQEYFDFDCEELILLDDDGGGDKDDEIDGNDQFHKEIVSNNNEERSDYNEGDKSPKLSENEEDDDLADKNLIKWAQKLKVFESKISPQQNKTECFQHQELTTKRFELEQDKKKHHQRDQELVTKNDQCEWHDNDHRQRKIPEIIQPPSLPTKRGKLRGVSAILLSKTKTREKINNNWKNLKNKIKVAEQDTDLNKKWHQKPSLEMSQKREKKKELQESRKEKLKKLAEEQQINKRKLNKESNDDVKIVKRPKVKVTQQNRGMFLTESSTSSTSFENLFLHGQTKLSTEIKTIVQHQTSEKEQKTATAVRQFKNNEQRSVIKNILMRRNSVHDINYSYIPEKRNLLERSNSIQNCKRSNSIDDKLEQSHSNHSMKEGSKPSKLSFSTIQYNFQSQVNDTLNVISILKVPGTLRKSKNLHVHFNEQPNTIYFEIETASRIEMKVNSKTKDAPAPKEISKFLQFNQNQQNFRHQIPLVDHFDEILIEVLSWKPEWLESHKHEIIESSQLCPILHQFVSFEEFKRTLFPLMKLELWASIEQDFINHQLQPFEILKLSSSHMEPKKSTIIIECLYHPGNIKDRIPLNIGELGIIKISESFYTEQFFACIRGVRKINYPNPHFEIILESTNNQVLRKFLGEIKEIKIKPITQMRAEVGSFNAVYSLQYSPLLKNILNPFENCKTKDVDIENLCYKGYDSLNHNQKEILLKTYIRSIDINHPNISLIEGPPGTGKSRIITNLAMQFLYGNEVKIREKKILICSQSNTAIDVICNKLLKIRGRMTSGKFSLVRFGILDRMHKNVQCISVQRLIQSYLKQNQNHIDKNPLNNEKIFLQGKIAELKKLNTRNSVNFDQLQELTQRLQNIEQLQNNHITQETEKSHYRKFVEGANIVCTTLCSAMKLLQYTKYFDICIIDEATQCTEQLSLIPLQFSIPSLILVGDTQQLPATVLSREAKNLGLGRSLFTRIQSCIQNQSNDCILKLVEQYRMHPEISYWPNKYFYNSRLINAESTYTKESLILPYIVYNLMYNQNSNEKTGKISNTLEAEFVVGLIKELSKILPPKMYQYGVITPYSEHRENLVKRIREEGFNEVSINTIDSYQGKEKDVIIISTARTKGVGFLAHSQRLNVALTRAKKCLILCGNFSTVEKIPSWKSLLDDAKARNRFHHISDLDATDIENKVICHIKTS